LLRLDPALHKRLRLLAVEEDTTVQQLGVEALEMLLQARR
jgi:predicted HicB family RNase H-like nuclease